MKQLLNCAKWVGVWHRFKHELQGNRAISMLPALVPLNSIVIFEVLTCFWV